MISRIAGITDRVGPRRAAIGAIAVGAIARLVVVLIAHRRGMGMADEDAYWELAGRLLAGHGYSFDHDNFDGYIAANEPTAYFGAAFPAIVAALRFASGESLLASRLVLGLASWLALAGGLLALLRPRVSPWTAAAAVGAAALYPNFHLLGAFLMTENVFIPATIWLLAGAARATEDDASALAKPRAFAWGFAYGLAHLVKQNLLFFQPAHAILVATRFARRPRSAAAFLAWTALGTALAVAPWAVRNRMAFGAWTLETKSGFNLCLMNHPGLNKPWHSEDFLGGGLVLPDMTGLNEAERSDRCRDRFLEWFRADPARYARLCVSRLLNSFALAPVYMEIPRAAKFAVALFNASLYLLAIAGLALSLARRTHFDLALLLAYAVAFSAATNASFRHRSYADPALLVFAILALAAALERFRRPRAVSPDPVRSALPEAAP